jgi:hypothetical protein
VKSKYKLVCSKPIYRVGITADGERRGLIFGCGRLECPACQQQWSKKVRWTIARGLEYGNCRHRFVTLTFATPHGPGDAAAKWRRFRKEQLTGWRFYRVFEAHQSGAVHIHFVTDKPIAEVKRARRSGESIASYKARQSDAGREFIALIERYGFGPITDVQPQRGSDAGLAGYLAKYLSKTSKSLSRGNGRRIRVAEGSRGWLPPGLARKPQYELSCITPPRDERERAMARAGSTTRSPYSAARAECNMKKWWAEHESWLCKTNNYFVKSLLNLLTLDSWYGKVYIQLNKEPGNGEKDMGVLSPGRMGTGRTGKKVEDAGASPVSCVHDHTPDQPVGDNRNFYELQEDAYEFLGLIREQRKSTVAYLRRHGLRTPLALIRAWYKNKFGELPACVIPERTNLMSLLSHSGAHLMRPYQKYSKSTTDFLGNHVWSAASDPRATIYWSASTSSRKEVSSPMSSPSEYGPSPPIQLTLGAGGVCPV